MRPALPSSRANQLDLIFGLSVTSNQPILEVQFVMLLPKIFVIMSHSDLPTLLKSEEVLNMLYYCIVNLKKMPSNTFKSNFLKPIVNLSICPSVRLFVLPTKSPLGPKGLFVAAEGCSPPHELERSPP